MLIPQRQSRLQQIIAERGMIDLDTLARELDVSSSTVRRDLADLEKSGLVRRTHGGVIWTGPTESRDSQRPYAFEQRMQFRVEAKVRIAVAAARLVVPGETVLLDGGSTTYYLARELLGTPLQIVTNSLPIASIYQNDEHTELVLIGGLMYPRYGVLLGPNAEAALGSIHVKTLFLSVAGLLDGAMYNQNMLLVQAERRMIEQSQRRVLLLDSTKFGQQALVKLGPISLLDTIITDAAPPEPIASQLRATKVNVIVAE
jgi:DeoR/GlpR family transcriptional regulator of sugar metabolism